MRTRTHRLLAAALLLALAVPAVRAADPVKGDLVETAVSAGTLTRFLAALRAADKVATLRAPGPFTVFVPSDDAFDKLPDGTLETLLRPENKDRLAALLAYHLVSGQRTSADLQTGKLDTLGGPALAIKRQDGTVMVNEARVVRADLPATNGVLHVIDKVLLPPVL